MTALTLRRIPFPVEKAIREKAAREQVSLNKAVVGILEETISGKKKTKSRRYHDLDWMYGIWSDKQSNDFLKQLDKTRPIDPELWQ
jgi:homogentisate 1,2-dioxygenase